MLTSKLKTTAIKKVAITTGDPNGIGFEVAAKALAQVKDRDVLFFLFRNQAQEKTQAHLFKKIDSRWNRLVFKSLEQAFSFLSLSSLDLLIKEKVLIDLSLSTSAADWFVQASRFCLDKKLDGLVTGPLSKTLIQKSGYSEIGHTGLLKKLLPKASLYMGFVGAHFNVLLATDHISLESVSKKLNKKSLSAAFAAAKKMHALLGLKKEIAVLGLNPHCGEHGVISSWESKNLNRLPKKMKGPLVPDAAFQKSNWSKYDLFLSLYHDQGLIPFKLIHGQDSGVHITIGLPFVRTSVDHGTAFDIFNKNMANCGSMLDAINLNLKLLRQNRS